MPNSTPPTIAIAPAAYPAGTAGSRPSDFNKTSPPPATQKEASNNPISRSKRRLQTICSIAATMQILPRWFANPMRPTAARAMSKSALSIFGIPDLAGGVRGKAAILLLRG